MGQCVRNDPTPTPSAHASFSDRRANQHAVGVRAEANGGRCAGSMRLHVDRYLCMRFVAQDDQQTNATYLPAPLGAER